MSASKSRTGRNAALVCRPKSLPFDRLEAARRRAIELNPGNAFERRSVTRTPVGRRGGVRRIAVLVARKWPRTGVRLSVSFMDTPTVALRKRILEHMNAWGKSANVVFSETRSAGQVRIARLDSAELGGYWSYIGTEILEVPEDEPTLNLEGFTMRVSDAEFRRVVRHEAGHTLGFEHEHMRTDLVRQIDREKAIEYFDRTQGWSEEEVDAQVLTPLSKKSIMGTTESDPESIMCYQLPASIMKRGRAAILGGTDINANDHAFARSLFPKPRADIPQPTQGAAAPQGSADRGSRNGEWNDVFELVVLEPHRSRAERRRGETRLPKYAQVLASYRGARVMEPMRLRSGPGEEKTRFGRIIGMHERIKAYTNRDRGRVPDDKELKQFGEDLFETLFCGDVRRLYDEARTARGRRRLDVTLTSMIPWIAEKPWEFAYDPGRGTFLATEEIRFVRNVLTNMPADSIVESAGPLRILVAAAQPVGFGRLSIEQEIAVIRRGFEPLIEAGLATVEVIARATPGQIHGRLAIEQFQVVHFIGHGEYDAELEEGFLVFETEPGRACRLGEREVREVFCGRGLSLVFLNACESGRGGRAEFNSGVAQSLVARAIPAVIANQYSVLDSSATSFAQYLYWSLAQGLSLGQAVLEARIAVNYAMHGEPIDWAIPVLYARDANSTLCAVPPAGIAAPVVAVREGMGRTIADRDIRIAVWDVDDVFPEMASTLDTLNAVQQTYGFELVDLSLPLDVWDIDTESDDGTPYLWAERLATRMQSKAVELRVDLLACVTRHWLRDDEWINLYAWWPDARKQSIVIVSVAGFDELQPAGSETDRALGNTLVSALAGYFGDLDSHENGSKSCPMYFDEDREFEGLVGAQRFDARCRTKLKRALGTSHVAALESLLKDFPRSSGGDPGENSN